MSNHASAKPDPVVTKMAALPKHDADHTVMNNADAPASTTTDIQPHAEDETPMPTSTETTKSIVPLFSKTGPNFNIPNSAGPACTDLQSTRPVPTVYPPRRPNVFRTRQKNVRYPISGLNAVAPVNVGNQTEDLEAADGFPVADMEEFQAEIQEKMRKKTASFMNKVAQRTWTERPVEDLGELFTIDN
ncbi:hypothetical protein B0T20DRAFT_443820 [Sordaria brevicollis]|uniref:Uncharacterized protein n=1 Tax=Sordaria brevicollis TaxID=83679 RepID=A0AAE0P9I3_SORBR|nr:hypothetical protein B0T20DRAFT_443820 [Sordaria brevicollis]